jgi:nucleoid-associated protein YgaU
MKCRDYTASSWSAARKVLGIALARQAIPALQSKESPVGFFDKLGKRDEDKPKADFSNVQAGSSTTSAEPAAPVPPPVSAPAQTYTVVAGDSLSKIAKRHYGDANKWPRIYEANRDQIKNPDLIHPGQQLKIPEA